MTGLLEVKWLLKCTHVLPWYSNDDFAKSHIQREREVIYQLFFSTWNHLVFFGCNVFRDSTRQRHCPECLENIQAPIESVRIFNIYFSSLIYTSESYEGSVDVDDYVRRLQALWNKLKDIIGLMSFYRLSKFREESRRVERMFSLTSSEAQLAQGNQFLDVTKEDCSRQKNPLWPLLEVSENMHTLITLHQGNRLYDLP